MIAQTETKQYTIDEYLELEIASETRSEYQNGEIIPMTGGTPNHNEIASILNAALRVSLKGKPYSIFIADQRLWIPDRTLYTYPDVMVLPKPLELQTGRKDTVVNPFFIAEVLSKSTKSYDRDEKFSAYRTIPTFQEYLLIDQYTAHVEQYSKTDSNKWIFTEYDDTESYISLSLIPFEIRLADIYEGLEFKPE
ncbi:Uma2 family endonuclease [Lusitaniella coriacea LEGE 07157]|uniref:Uma2 family endonuclease n=1 Tax=Lusitaniella coriacea LEGE 07157 TaxID=945747 RepID=A0A8J7DVL0_9CYAN|nr:Uma2 family endonuclease [Lusitaniella coriacea]MBE9115852.1 Uma2 family endonuclease [Lusitaniella coriacea LEGE 07157]